MTDEKETFEFQAHTRQLLDLVIHSLYSNKEIFLRELISNASDALDRLRFEALTDGSLLERDERLGIRLEVDSGERVLSVVDNGIGMSRQEVIDNLGTIAKSGTREIVARLEGDESPEALAELIGQFGVGFYSAFMVADEVTVLTRRAGEEKATKWSSRGGGEYRVEEANRFFRGTTVTLRLKPKDAEDGLEDFTDPQVLRRIVKRYSDFVAYPIVLRQGEAGDGGEEAVLNSMRPLWTRSAAEVEDGELAEFYKHIAHDWNAPLETLWLRAEGRIDYRAILFIPSRRPLDAWLRDLPWGLQLYVRRVLIMDHCEGLLPPYLRFVKGVVESADLPLNVSREIVQQDRHIAQMRRWLTRKVLDRLAELKAEAGDRYRTFWDAFGSILKEGVAADPEQRPRLLPLLLFRSSAAEGGWTDLPAYLERMTEGQQAIFYLTGESVAVVEASPHLEAFRARDVEVLLLTDPIDEILVQAVDEFEGKPLRPIDAGDLPVGDETERRESEAERERQAERYGALLASLQEILEPWVKEVRLTARLVDSAACLVTEEHEPSPRLERLLRRARGEPADGWRKRILELNFRHPLLRRLEAARTASTAELEPYAHLLLGSALLAEGSELPEPGRFREALGEVLLKSLEGGAEGAVAAPDASGPAEG